MSKKTGRYFNALLYIDDERYPCQIQALNDYYRWVGAVHDKDIDNDGNLKKPHVHVVARLSSSNATTLRSFVDRVDLCYKRVHEDGSVTESVHAQVCNSFRSSLRYLTHADDLNKFQYGEDCLIGTNDMIGEAHKAINNVTLDSKVLELLDRLDDIDAPINSYSEFLRFACGLGLYSAVRSIAYSEVIKEHNERYYQSKESKERC